VGDEPAKIINGFDVMLHGEIVAQSHSEGLVRIVIPLDLVRWRKLTIIDYLINVLLGLSERHALLLMARDIGLSVYLSPLMAVIRLQPVS